MVKLKKSIKLILLLMGMWLMIHSICIIIDGLNDELQTTDVGVVLGNKVQLDGRPSERLKSRLDKTEELYKKGYFPLILVSGGTGKEGFDEAKVMKAYLVDKGIPKDRIIEDPQGNNSYMTAQHTKSVMDNRGLESAMIITQYYHISRTKLAFEKLGIKNPSSAHADIMEWRDVYSIVREFPAYYKYLLT